MIDSTGGLVNLAQTMHQARLKDQHETLMLKKINDQTREQGDQALQLLQSVPQAGNSGSGRGIDLYA